MSRGTAMSMSTSGRRARCSMTSSMSSGPMSEWGGGGERRGVGGDDDVGVEQPLRELVEGADRPAEAVGQRAGAAGVAVGDEDRRDALVGQRLRRALARLARADDDDAALREVADGLARELDGDRRDADPLAADAGLRADALARLERGAEQAVRHRAGRARRQRELVRAADLALDLGLADDHRLEPAGDAVELARGVAVARRVDDLREGGRADARARGELRERIGLGLHRVGRDEVELGAVAGRDRDRLLHLVVAPEGAQELRGLARAEREALADLDRRGLERDAEGEQLAHRRAASSSASRAGAGSDGARAPWSASSLSSVSSRSKRDSFEAMITT